MDKLNFVKYSEKYVDLSWDWLHDPEIKKLVMSSDISKEDQVRWFERLINRNDYYIWGIELNDAPIGAVGVKNIDLNSKKGEYFGYIGAKEFWGRGIGWEMLNFFVSFAMQKGLNEVYLRVSKDNTRAIRLYERYGFSYIEQDGTENTFLLAIKIK